MKTQNAKWPTTTHFFFPLYPYPFESDLWFRNVSVIVANCNFSPFFFSLAEPDFRVEYYIRFLGVCSVSKDLNFSTEMVFFKEEISHKVVGFSVTPKWGGFLFMNAIVSLNFCVLNVFVLFGVLYNSKIVGSLSRNILRIVLPELFSSHFGNYIADFFLQKSIFATSSTFESVKLPRCCFDAKSTTRTYRQ